MSENTDNRDNQNQEDIRLYRQRRVDQFRMHIEEDDSLPEAQADSDFSDEITSFSDESTRAQIERDSKRELRRQKNEEKKIRRIKAGQNKKVYHIAWIAVVIILSVVASQFLIIGSNDFLAITREDETPATIIIEADDTVNDVAKKLEDKGVINSTGFFSVFANITGKIDDMEPGVYQIPKNKDYLAILNHLQFTGNRQTTITLQITEGTNVLDLAHLLYESGVTYDVDEFLRLCNSDEFDEDYSFLADIDDNPNRIYKLEGYLFPDTYEFYVDEAPDLTIRRFLDNFYTRVFETQYEVKGYSDTVTISQLINDKRNYTLDEIVNMASIVQGESASSEEMFKVSSVIHNRLDYGPQYDIHTLGMDSTAYYPYKNADSVPEEELESFVSTYGTYEREGLPPGAINSPCADALIAAVAPSDTDYLYFCHGVDSDGTVTSYFASDYSTHMSNLSKAGLN
ncbi:MAG: endolytic transglycosylase MltG [Ruminococcus sp.]|nr:endolytic transglycosylase MltG [Ruminococcus sp.]